jgi:hypothetical protein
MNKIIFISDYFLEEILGGAEKNNDAFINKASQLLNIEKIKSCFVDENFILKNANNFFIVANFFQLSENVKLILQKKCKYIIYEHDHKYVSTNNPANFENFFVPDEYLINLNFYSNAKAVLCQSKLHSEILYKNTLLTNIINLGGNVWSDEDLQILKNNIDNKKNIKFGIYETKNKNKGFTNAIDYCLENNLSYTLIKHQEYNKFINNLSFVENLIFLPQWVETYSRLAVEARILNCKLITNDLIGAASEDYFLLKGMKLFEYIEKNSNNIVKKVLSIINEENQQYFKSFDIPKITFITSLYKGEKYISNFLNNITNLDLFETTEVLMYNANSPENEFSIIEPYLEKFKNIKYIKLNKNYSPSEIHNFAITDSTGEFLTTSPVDDIREKNYIRTMIRNLINVDKEIVLVYGDTLQTNKENETFEKNSATSIYEHSKEQFSNENMIKSLPGPMPVWRKSVHKIIGYYREDLKYPIDWEMWLRMIKYNFKFKKINKIVGLYYFNPNGLTTSNNNVKNKLNEEAKVFFEYKEIFGNNFKKY